MKLGQAATTPAQWKVFVRKYRAEMSAAEPTHALDLLAALSHGANFSVGCYCVEESRCHRSILRALLIDKGAAVA
jgi:uncharacterized protein YeaO (DUF488 family)